MDNAVWNLKLNNQVNIHVYHFFNSNNTSVIKINNGNYIVLDR